MSVLNTLVSSYVCCEIKDVSYNKQHYVDEKNIRGAKK